MRIDCAWCGDTLVPGQPEPISHGLCDDCAPKIHPNIGYCPHCKRQGFISTGLKDCRCDVCKVGVFGRPA